MNEFFKNLFSKIGKLWANMSMQQRIFACIIALVVIIGIVALFRVSAKPVMSPVFNYPIRDEEVQDRIIQRLDQENVKVTVTANGIVQVQDDATARRMRAILIREDLVPSGISAWEVFDRDRWNLTDLERNKNLQRALTNEITALIKSYDEVDNAKVTIVWPKEQIFTNRQNPTSASVIITPKPGSDITENRRKIEGIQKILITAVEGLTAENITITDHRSNVLNDFDGREAFDRLDLITREQKFVSQMESKYRDQWLASLQSIFTSNRVRDLNVKIDIDLSKMSVGTKEILPTTIRERTPGLAYDDSIIVEKIEGGYTKSSTTWEGTGFNPEGPTGVEGHVTPPFKDMQNLYGRMESNTDTTNFEWGERKIEEERSPQIGRITVSTNIDGTWKIKYNAKGEPIVTPEGTIEREYTPVPDEVLRDAVIFLRDAIGFTDARGYSVSVTNIPFDRTEELRQQDAEYFRKKQIQTTIIIFLSGLILLLFGFILFRAIQREIERRRRLEEEKRALREQMLRESAIADAEQEGMDVSITMEERTRMELMETAINMAKEHPEDAAQLIRTWLLEE